MMASTISKAASGRGSLSIRLRRDSYPLLFIMTSVGGFCASYSFLARGGVFAFAQRRETSSIPVTSWQAVIFWAS